MRTLLFAVVAILLVGPAHARDAGFTSSCSVDCLLTACSIQCSAGAGGGAACTCAWGFASCACGGGGSASLTISRNPVATNFSSDSQAIVWREAAPTSPVPQQQAGRAPVPATPQSTVFVPTEAKKAQFMKLESLLRVFATPASQQALRSAKDVHRALLAGDVPGYKKAGEEYAKALQGLTPDQRAALAVYIEALEACPARESLRPSASIK